MEIFKKMKGIVSQKAWIVLMIGIVSMMAMSFAAITPGTDPLAGVQSSVQADFGSSSGFMYIAYFTEIVLAVITYIKTKNLLVLPGVMIVLAFTAIAPQMLPTVV